MNNQKKLSDEDRREWEQNLITLQESYGVHEIVFAPVDLCALIESEKAGWEEVERLNIESQGWEDEYMALKRRYEELDRSALETSNLLKDASSKLQDALTVISDALTDVMDMLEVSEMEHRDMELCPQANMLSLHDELQAAIDRIQEGNGHGDC